MEDLISIVVLIIYFVVVRAAGKNKKQKKAARRAARRQAVQFDRAFEHLAKAMRTAGQGKPETQPPAIRMDEEAEGSDPCHEEMLAPQRPAMQHMPVSQAEMRSAAEGEDPCHAGDAPAEDLLEDSPVYRSPIFDTEDQVAFAQDVLRGVVMSEVLNRPDRHRRSSYVKWGA